MIIHKSAVKNEKKIAKSLASLIIFLLLFNGGSYLLTNDANAQTENIPTSATPKVAHDMCKCVIFRLDDVNSKFLQSVQIDILNTFISKNQSMSLGLIMHNTDPTSTITGKIKEGMQKGLFELDVHGWDHVDYTQLSQEEQLSTLKQANSKMNAIFGHYSHIFIPPYNKFDGDTIGVLKSSGIQIFSADTSSDKTSYFIADGTNVKPGTTLYHLPAMTTFKSDNGNGTWIKIPISTILAQIDNGISKYGYAVVLLHPQNFAKIENGVYVNVVDEHEISDLSSLIDSVTSQNLKITTFTNVVGLDKTYSSASTIPEFRGIEVVVLLISLVSAIVFTAVTKKDLFMHTDAIQILSINNMSNAKMSVAQSL